MIDRRRWVWIFCGVLLWPTLGACAQPAAAPVKTVKGRVILDLNRNGQLDLDEKGLPDILVSDGIQFVRTAADGSYSIDIADDPLIPYRPARVVAVRWPSGTWPVAQRFHARLSDLKPGQSVDFFLRTMKQQLPFTLVHGTDPHNNLAGSETFRDEIERMVGSVDFSVFTGDLGYAGRDSAEQMFASIQNFTRKFPIPMLHTPGNHDIPDIHTDKWTEQSPLTGYGPYTKYLGPIRWSFDYAGVHIVGLDWARIAEDGKLQTGVPDTVIDWLVRDLKHTKPGTRIFVFMHHHHRTDEKFWDVLVKHKVELLLAGHSHRNLDQSRRGVKALTTMNLRGPYRLLTVHDEGHDIINRCHGCKDYLSNYHSKHCQLFQPTARGKRGAHQELVERQLDGVLTLAGKAKHLEIIADFEPTTAKKFGIRLTPGGEKPEILEIACSGEELQVGRIRTAAVPVRGQKSSHLHVFVENGMLRVYANHRVQFERVYQPAEACAVTLFAEGGRALLKRVDVWETTKAP